MIIDKIRELYLIRQIRKLNHQNQRSRDFVDFEQIRKTLILFEQNQIDQAIDLGRLLNTDNKECYFFCFRNNETIDEVKGRFFSYSKQNIDWKGFPNESVCNKFTSLDEKCDLLIDITTDKHLSLCILSSLSKQKLKIGIKKEGIDIYDLILEVEKNIDIKFLSKQIMFYLRRLKSQRKESDQNI